MGKWNKPPRTRFYICTNNQLWEERAEGSRRYDIRGRRRQCVETNTIASPRKQKYVEIIEEGGRIRMDQIIEHSARDPEKTWRSCTDKMGGATTEMLENLVLPQGIKTALKVLSEGQACACTDGSVKDGEGTAAFVCAPVNDPYNPILRGATNVQKGHKMTSTRAELMGILLLYRSLEAIQRWSNIKPIVYAACDSTAALCKATLDETQSANTADYDIIREIQESQARIQEVEWCHVMGHADRKKPSKYWTVHEVLNIAADNLANMQHHQENRIKGTITRRGVDIIQNSRN